MDDPSDALSVTAAVQVCYSTIMCKFMTCVSLLTTCVTVLQISVAAKIQVTCPFVVPFNQASQVINCWSAQDVGNKGLHHRHSKL